MNFVDDDGFCSDERERERRERRKEIREKVHQMDWKGGERNGRNWVEKKERRKC